MDVDELVATYPRLYHMAEDGSWAGIRQHGLLSTSALLDLFEVDGDLRMALESARRPESVTITHAVHGTAVVRDQIPLREGPLAQCLVGMTPVGGIASSTEGCSFGSTRVGSLDSCAVRPIEVALTTF